MAMQKPVATFRAGSVSCAVGETEVGVEGPGPGPGPGQPRAMLKATIERRYRDKEGEWKSSGSFGRNDIPLAIYCLQQAFEKIIETQHEDSGNGNTNSNTSSNNIEEVVI